MPFIKNSWTVEISKIPKYVEFKEEFQQPLDYHLCKLLMESDNENLTPEMKEEFQDKIMNNIDKNTGVLKVSHNNTKYKIGRWYGNQNVSIIPHSKYFKHTLFSYLGWLDLDMIKGHATIACCMGNAVGLDFKHIKYYINNFDDIANEMIDFYSSKKEGDEPLQKSDVKNLFNLMIYGGGFNTWKEELAIGNPKKNVKPKFIQNDNIFHPIAENYKAQCDDIAKKIYIANPSLVRKLAEKDEDRDKLKGKVVSYWFQIIENHIIHICYQLSVEKRIIERNVCGLEYDGVNLPRAPFSIDKEQLITQFNDKILQSTGLNVMMKFKDYDPKYVLTDIIEMRKNMVIPVYDEEEEEQFVEITDPKNNYREVFKGLVDDFEKEHNKILNTGNYVSKGHDEIIIRGDKNFKDSYKHIQCGYKDGKPVAFVDVWMNCNDKIKRYDYMDIYPKASLCPSNVYNIWQPFVMEKFTEPYVKKDKELKFILNHIKILCDNDDVVTDFVIKWIAQMIQFPEVKSYVLTFISNEGAGKGRLMELFSRMMGEKKIHESSTPSRDIWGSFNGLMSAYFLINLNELSKSETKGNEGQMKAMITDGTITINPKGVAQYKTKSYHRFIITTNKEDPVVTKKDDRRNIIIRSSDEKIGDKDYWKEISKYLEDDDVIRTCYDYFKSIEDMDKFRELPLPITDYQNNLKEGNRDVLDLWMEQFTFMNRSFVTTEQTPIEIYNDFCNWRDVNSPKYEINKQKLMVRINLMFRNYVTAGRHTDSGNNKIFDIEKLKIKYDILQY
jgi:hypothetical protein